MQIQSSFGQRAAAMVSAFAITAFMLTAYFAPSASAAMGLAA